MANLIKQKFLEGIDSTKFKVAQNGAIIALDSSGNEVEILKLDANNNALLMGVEKADKSALEQEVSDRAAAVSTEAAARVAGDAALQDQIDNIISNTDAAALDSLSEIVAAFQDADGNLNSAITNLANSASSDLDAEEAARIAGDSALDARLDVLEGADTVEGSVAKALKDAKAYTDQEVGTEETRAMAAESALQSDIDAEETRAMAAESALQSDIDAEETRALAAEGVLQTAIDDEETRAMAAEAALQSDIDAEETRAMAAESALQSDIDAEETRAMAAESALQSDIDAEETRALAAEGVLQGNIDAEEAARIAGDSALDARLDVLEGADTVEGSVAKALKDAKAYTDQEVGTEETRALAAESLLQAGIDSETAARIADVNAEETRALAAEADLQSQLDDLDGYAQEIRSDLDQEIADRIADVNAEETRALAAESALQSDIDAEETRALAAEAALQAEIDAEETARAAAVTAEETARIAGDANLQSQINNILSNVDPVALDSLTEVVAAFQDADSDLNDAITALGTGSQSALAQEIADRIADVNAEETRALAAEAALQSDIDAEETRALAAESALQSDIDAEETRALAAESALQSDIDAEVTAREADVDAEEARALAAEGVLQGNIDAEAASRAAEDLTFFKHDGSRALTGNMDADFNEINNIVKATVKSEATPNITNTIQSNEMYMLYDETAEGGAGFAKHIWAGFSHGFRMLNHNPETYDAEGALSYGSWGVNSKLDNGGLVHEIYDNDASGSVWNAKVTVNEYGIQNFGASNNERWGLISQNFDNYSSEGNVVLYAVDRSMTINAGGSGSLSLSSSNNLNISTNNTLASSSSDIYMVATNHVRVATANGLKLFNTFSTDENGDYNAPFEPSSPEHATTKAYVDAMVNSKVSGKETFEIDTASELTHVDLAVNPSSIEENSVMIFVNRLAVHEGVDYTISTYVDESSYEATPVARITWIGDFAQGEIEGIEMGDVIRVSYRATV